MTTGIVVATLDAGSGDERIRTVVRAGTTATPPGRALVFSWRVPELPTLSQPIEAILTDEVLGRPEQRGENRTQDPWLYYASVVSRHFIEGESGSLELSHASMTIIFRRQGSPPYGRAKDPSAPLTDRLDSTAPAFTRDVANNTWTFLSDHDLDRVIARVARLMAWRDEDIVSVTADGRIEVRNDLRAWDLSTEILGVPTKASYTWDVERQGPGQLGFGATD